MKNVQLLTMALALFWQDSCIAFQTMVPLSLQQCDSSRSMRQRYGSARLSTSSSSSLLQLRASQRSSPTGDFELQELKAQIESMKRQGVASRSLSPTKRLELETYTRSIVENKETPIPLEQVGQRLAGTKWRLVFSTDNAALSNLPRDATVFLDFEDDEKTMKYSLVFGEKTQGLNSITAHSTWTAGQGNNIDGKNPGLVALVYDKISCDAFGLKSLGVGFFGLLKGRASYIQTVYFDDDLWIDGGYDADGSPYFSVYTQEDNW